MSFQAYIDNIKKKTGKSPEDFKKLAERATPWPSMLHLGAKPNNKAEIQNVRNGQNTAFWILLGQKWPYSVSGKFQG